MRKRNNILLYFTITLLVLNIYFLINVGCIYITETILLICMILVNLLFIYMYVKRLYKEYIIEKSKRKKWTCKIYVEKLNKEEKELVDDAIKLIKKVSEDIKIEKFKVYKVRHIKDGWFLFDEYDEKNKLKIFIPFDEYIIENKDYCFMMVLHEILHSQNLKDYINIFEKEFLEGLNHYLTIWLINKYSKKYKVPEYINVILFKTKNRTVKIRIKNNIYIEEAKLVRNSIYKSGKEVKEIFVNYVNFKPEYFKKFLPNKFFK